MDKYAKCGEIEAWIKAHEDCESISDADGRAIREIIEPLFDYYLVSQQVWLWSYWPHRKPMKTVQTMLHQLVDELVPVVEYCED